ncbi:Bax inhibitor-1/YccA family protein [Aquabacterium sp.]|uniref:Bax inhibitor-1/YccA family protein n=1 Tax=Aquabacterium sp. TaxID=1872578 RepID=UPI0019BA1ECC|nr:Bax inhibitor-1/YccA family protein [Aquabacterium sp.]MBC7700757.1 Bax inhibitor-1/YccA family protein [Aquabacterium sp.]
MDQSLKPLDVAYSGAFGAERQRVLRNTYALLALSMIPTVLGAWLGVAMNFSLFAANPMIGFVAFMAIAFGFFYGIEKFKDSGVGVLLLLGFTFFMGLMLSRLIGAVLGFSNGVQLISFAFGGTALVFVGMATLASTMKRDISSMGKWLFMGVIVLLLAGVANIWLQLPALMLTVAAMSVVIFSAFMLYDLKRIIDGGETNYVSATLAIYLDVYNVFQSLLSILGFVGGDRD